MFSIIRMQPVKNCNQVELVCTPKTTRKQPDHYMVPMGSSRRTSRSPRHVDTPIFTQATANTCTHSQRNAKDHQIVGKVKPSSRILDLFPRSQLSCQTVALWKTAGDTRYSLEERVKIHSDYHVPPRKALSRMDELRKSVTCCLTHEPSVSMLPDASQHSRLEDLITAAAKTSW